jgi:ABC-type lipoprotein export system ATPase subunit
MLEINQLTKSYTSASGEKIIVLEIGHLRINRHEKVALVGPSGSGKSTLLNSIAGIIHPTSGSINLLNTNILDLSEGKMDTFRAQNIGYVFQNFNLLPGFTAVENIVIAMRFAKSIRVSQQKSRAKELLKQVGLEHHLESKVERLSNGEQQRVAIARALANNPSIVLADEPTASLDYKNTEIVYSMLVDVCAENAAALLLCTHDMELAKRMDRTESLSKRIETEKIEHVSN